MPIAQGSAPPTRRPVAKLRARRYLPAVIEASEIEARIIRALPDAEIAVRDLTGARDHYEVRVVAELFSGMSQLERHRKIYALFSDVLGGALHALSLTTRAPDEAR